MGESMVIPESIPYPELWCSLLWSQALTMWAALKIVLSICFLSFTFYHSSSL